MSEILRLLALARPYRAGLALGGALMLAESMALLAVPWLGGLVVAAILDGTKGGIALPALLAGMLAAFATQAVLRFGAAYRVQDTADRMIADLKVRLYDHLQSLPVGYFQERRLGESLALLTSDVYVIGGFMAGPAVSLVPLLVTAGGAAILMLNIRADLALLALVLVPALYLALKVAGRLIRPASALLQEEEARSVALAQENLSMLVLIKVFAREGPEARRFRDQVERVLSMAARQRRVLVALGPLVQFVAGAGVVLIVAVASSDLFAGRLAPADLVAFLLYAGLLTRPIAGLADVYGQCQAARGALARLERVMIEPAEAPPHAATDLPRVRGEVEWRGVTFGYPQRSPALARVDLHVAAGEWVAIVGPNGAGKSTLAHLLTRLHDPCEGAIAIDGIDIATVSLASLRGQVGVVPQHMMLFHATVRDNIAYGRAAADPGAVERAARAAGAHDFISRLPHGYDTVVGDRGVKLSGGEQQRVALARALLKDPPILVLDEATAMFDPAGESEFLRSCRETFGRRTVIFITHRPASLGVVDRIVHLRAGRVERIERASDRALRLVGEA